MKKAMRSLFHQVPENNSAVTLALKQQGDMLHEFSTHGGSRGGVFDVRPAGMPASLG